MNENIIFPIVFVFFFAVAWLIFTYNKFIKYQNRIDESRISIDVALKRRFNLVPNLVSVVKGYENHETATLERKISHSENREFNH